MESTLKKECICKKMIPKIETKKTKHFGLLNPAFEDLDISEIHFPDSSPTPFVKVDTLSDTGLTCIESRVDTKNVTLICPDSPLESSVEVDSLFNSMRATPLRTNKKYRNNCCRYFLWFLVWCIITVSFAGIFASVATIIWLETYKEVKLNTNEVMNFSVDYDTISSSTESPTYSTLINDE